MASDVEICKLGLSHLGDKYNISSLAERSKEANLCNLLYGPARDDTLRAYPWNFAKTYTTPATLAGTVPGKWTYMYKYPADALAVQGIMNPTVGDDTPIKYEVVRHAIHGKVVLTDLLDATIVSTYAVTDPNEFDPSFIMAMSYNMAKGLAIPLTMKRQIMLDMNSLYINSLFAAQTSDANEGTVDQAPEAEWIRSR